MISYRRADLLENVIKNRIHDVFFYIWIPTDNAVGHNTQAPVRQMHGLWYAYLEVYFPDKLTKRDDEEHVTENIRRKIESSIGQPIKQHVLASRGEDLSNFFTRITKDFKSKLEGVGETPIEGEAVNHGYKIHLRMKGI